MGLAILAKSVKPEWIKNYINQELTQLTGEPSQIKGDIHWQIFPMPGIQVQTIEIGEKQKHPPLYLHLDKLNLKLKLTPLFKGNIVFNKIEISGLNATLDSNHTSESPQSSQPKDHPSSKDTSDSSSHFNFAIDSFQIDNSNLQFIQGNSQINVTEIKAEVSELQLNDQYFPVKLKSQANLSDSGHTLNLNLTYSGKIKLSKSFLSHQDKPSQLSSEGLISITDIVYDTFKVDEISSNTKIENGTISLNPLNIRLYDGRSTGSAEYQFKKQSFEIKQTATDINAGAIFSSLLGKQVAEGTLDFTLNSSGSLKGNNWVKSIKASGNASIKDGKLLFVDVDKLVNDINIQFDKLLSSEKINLNMIGTLSDINPSDYQQGITAFNLLNVGFKMTKNLFVKDTVAIQTKQINLSGEGYIDLDKMKIDNQIMLKVINPPKRLLELQSLFEDGIPLILSGDLQAPVLYPDVPQMTKIASQKLVHKALNKPINQLKDEFKNFLGR